MADWDFILAPATVTVQFKLDEVAILLNSLRLLNNAKMLSGLGEWVQDVTNDLSNERMRTNEVVAESLAFLQSELSHVHTFPEFINLIPEITDDDVQMSVLGWIREYDDYPGDDEILANEEHFVDTVYNMVSEKYAKKGHAFEDAIWRQRYYYATHPTAYRELAIEHLTYMWDKYLKPEWKRIKPVLQEAVDAHQSQDYSGMTGFEAIETITGRNMRSSNMVAHSLEQVNTLTFMPSPHVGPYIGFGAMDKDEQVFFFGARLPKNAVMKSTALSRSELLVRLNALADETRLKILELLTEHNELCAQDFITTLDLSQSSASRHLRQLTASGYVSERRRDVAKCYSLNPERIDDTIQALKDFLQKS